MWGRQDLGWGTQPHSRGVLEGHLEDQLWWEGEELRGLLRALQQQRQHIEAAITRGPAMVNTELGVAASDGGDTRGIQVSGGAEGSPHLGDFHIGRVSQHGAVGLPVPSIADELRVPDAEIAPARRPLREDGDGRPGGQGEMSPTPQRLRGRVVLPRVRGPVAGKSSHRMLPRLVAYWMWVQRKLNISPTLAQSRASNTCGMGSQGSPGDVVQPAHGAPTPG